jgi:hypothetical protein
MTSPESIAPLTGLAVGSRLTDKLPDITAASAADSPHSVRIKAIRQWVPRSPPSPETIQRYCSTNFIRTCPSSELDSATVSERKVITTRVASNHPLSAYGGVQHPDELLERLADGIRTGALPLILEHDHARPLDAHCLSAEVVGLPDGHKAVAADFEVDGAVWDAHQDELRDKGVPGGMSFTYAEIFSELTPRDPARSGRFGLTADASHFTDEAIAEAGAVLTKLGTVRVGRLYQFADVPTCRVVIEYVQQSGGLDAAVRDVGIAIAGSAIYDALKKLFWGRSTTPAVSEPSQIEIHKTTESDGVSEQRLLVRTDSEDVLKDAMDRFSDGIGRPERLLVWDDTLGDWTEP